MDLPPASLDLLSANQVAIVAAIAGKMRLKDFFVVRVRDDVITFACETLQKMHKSPLIGSPLADLINSQNPHYKTLTLIEELIDDDDRWLLFA